MKALGLYTHTHTHTGTFRKIKKVANEATLYCVENRTSVSLYEEKIVKAYMSCFLCCSKFYTNLKTLNLTKIGGVEYEGI